MKSADQLERESIWIILARHHSMLESLAGVAAGNPTSARTFVTNADQARLEFEDHGMTLWARDPSLESYLKLAAKREQDARFHEHRVQTTESAATP